MKILLTTIAALLLVGCGESQQSTTLTESKPAEPVSETVKPEPPTAKAPDISIHDAAKGGNIEAVKQHLNDGADVELKCVNCGGTVLGHAAWGGSKEVAVLLIAEGADVNAKDKDGKTPFASCGSLGSQGSYRTAY